MYNATKALASFKFAGATMDGGVLQLLASLVPILPTAVAFAYSTLVPIESDGASLTLPGSQFRPQVTVRADARPISISQEIGDGIKG